MQTRASFTQVNRSLSKWMDRATEQDDVIYVERRGKPDVVLLEASKLYALKLELAELLARAYENFPGPQND